MGKGILERLAEGPVLGDGGYLPELERRGWVQAGPFTPEVSLSHPEAVTEQREFLRAGAEVPRRQGRGDEPDGGGTPDRDFILDQLPEAPRVWLAVGAGHAFKFASALGRCLSELVLDGETAADLEAFRIGRPILWQDDPPRTYMI